MKKKSKFGLKLAPGHIWPWPFRITRNCNNLMILTSDVSTSAGLDRFRKKFPNNYLDVGILNKI